MDDTTLDEWMSFFRDAGIPPNVSASYASSFCQNRIHLNMVLELNRDLLKELGVTLIGDAIAILRHAKSFHEQNVRQKILNLMSSECQKPPEFCKKLSTAVTANSKTFNGDISIQAARPMENNHSAITVACRNVNNQEVLRLRKQSQLTPKQNSLQSYGISTSIPVPASPSQVYNTAQNISVGTSQREELQVCEALGEAETSEEMSAPYDASKSQNNLWSSHSECFIMRAPVRSSSTLPLREAAVPSRVSGGNIMCRRNQDLKRSTQQSPYTTIVSSTQQPTGRLPYGVPSTPTACHSPMPRIGSNTLQDVPAEIFQTQSTKRKRTLSHQGSHEQEQFDPNACMRSVRSRVVRQPGCETQSTVEMVHSERSQVQESSQLGGLSRQDVKDDVTATEDPTENHSSLEPQCQLHLQRKQEESPLQICTHGRTQERLQMSQSLPDKRPQSQIMSESQLPSHKPSPSQLSFLRRSQSHLQYHPGLKLHHDSLSSLPLQPSVQPQPSYAGSPQTKAHKNLELQNQKVMVGCNSARSCSTAKLILATGKKINEKFKLLHSHSQTPYMTPVPQSSECYRGKEIERQVSSVSVSGCRNKSVLKDPENREKEECVQTILESDNATCVSQNGCETEFMGAGENLQEEELSCLTDLNTEKSTARWGTNQLSQPVAHTSDSYLDEDPSSHTFGNSDNDAENDLQHERVPGQIFSRLGVKVESVEDNFSNTSVKNDALPRCRFGNNVKYKINKSGKHKNLSNKFAKIMAVKQLRKNKLPKRKIVFTAFQKASTTGRQNIVPDQASQEVTSVDGGQPKLRGILKPQTITSKQQEDMEPQKEEEPQKMTANLLLESVTRSEATDLDIVSDDVHFEEKSVSNDCTKSEDGDYIYQDDDNFCSDNEQQEELSRVPTSGMCKTVHFGPVCVKEFDKNVLPSSGKVTTNSRQLVFRRLGARRKGI